MFKFAPQIALCDAVREVAHKERLDGRVARWERLGRRVGEMLQHLARDGIVCAVEAVLDVLVGERCVLVGHFVPERALVAARARALGKEAAELCAVALVVRARAGEALQHFVGGGRGLAVVRVRVGRAELGFLVLGKVLFVDLADGDRVVDLEDLITDLHGEA